MMKRIITVSREFGSGGREVGLQLAQALHIPFYDKELIALAAKAGGLSPAILEQYEEAALKTNFITARPALFALYQQPITDKIFVAQCHVIRKLAEQGPCVIVGRCADYVLQDSVLNVFVHADMPAKVRRKLSMDTGIPESEMEKHILLTDKKRQKYYAYYTNQVWGEAKNYHLSVNSSMTGIQGCIETILCYYKHLNEGGTNQ
jgi:cytidylate kinase